ncbi:MAG: transposase family protein, partial [Tannerella sp.]|nr:transposase family protein [Tannerella sp.]
MICFIYSVLYYTRHDSVIFFSDCFVPSPCLKGRTCQDEEEQKSKYSGKKKRHTVKNAVIISCCCMVLYVSPTFDGRIHDKKIADTAYRIPPGFTLAQDTGYQGYRPEGVRVIQPVKKPKGKEITAEQKQD